jgi:hypothetical protein
VSGTFRVTTQGIRVNAPAEKNTVNKGKKAATAEY